MPVSSALDNGSWKRKQELATMSLAVWLALNLVLRGLGSGNGKCEGALAAVALSPHSGTEALPRGGTETLPRGGAEALPRGGAGATT